MRDLFTQALKSIGEVEDGEYDWMKLNNGKGWEAMKHSSPAQLHGGGTPNESRRELRGNPRDSRATNLNKELPKPGAVRTPGDSTRYPRPGAQDMAKRQSRQDLGPPEGSTAAQFQASTQNLAGPSRLSQQVQATNVDDRRGPGPGQGPGPVGQMTTQQRPMPDRTQGGQQEERQKKKWYQPILSMCCGRSPCSDTDVFGRTLTRGLQLEIPG